jgi:hypothetical protein
MEKLNDFMLLFRMEPNFTHKPTDVELAEQKKHWGTWIGGIAAQARLVSTSQLGFSGKQLHADMSVKEGVSIAAGQTLGGNMILKAKNIDEALEISKGCPILSMGGTVEVRDIIPMQN